MTTTFDLAYVRKEEEPVLPPPRGRVSGIEAVYAFCREIDDLADEPRPGPGGSAARRAAERLDLYREEIERCYGGAPTLPVMRQLQECIARFGIERGPLLALVEGVEMDFHRARYETFEELREYCFRVASAVGLACIHIWGFKEEKAKTYAESAGIAVSARPDPFTTAVVSGALVVVAIVAGALPAARAARVPPAEALRSY